MLIAYELFTICISSYLFYLFLLFTKSTYELLIHNSSNDIVNIKFKNIYNYLNTVDYNNCIICFEKYNPNCNIIILPCNHYYHHNCILDWIISSNSYNCPYCNKKYMFDYD